MTIKCIGNSVLIGDRSIDLDWPILDAREGADKVYVLMDPGSYMSDPDYKNRRREGGAAIRNLIAFTKFGSKLWEAELPEESDYYYKIISVDPLVVNSFSSFRCEICIDDGSIKTKSFFK